MFCSISKFFVPPIKSLFFDTLTKTYKGYIYKCRNTQFGCKKWKKIKNLFFTLKNPEITCKGICYIDMLLFEYVGTRNAPLQKNNPIRLVSDICVFFPALPLSAIRTAALDAKEKLRQHKFFALLILQTIWKSPSAPFRYYKKLQRKAKVPF